MYKQCVINNNLTNKALDNFVKGMYNVSRKEISSTGFTSVFLVIHSNVFSRFLFHILLNTDKIGTQTTNNTKTAPIHLTFAKWEIICNIYGVGPIV